MSALNDKELKWLLDNGQFPIHPTDERVIQPASIDLRLGDTRYRYLLDRYELGSHLAEEQIEYIRFESLVLAPAETAFVGLEEIISIPTDMLGLVMPRSSLTRLGIHITPVYMNPGYQGVMPITIHNQSGIEICLRPGARVVQLILLRLGGNARSGYREAGGKYYNEEVSPSLLDRDQELDLMLQEVLGESSD